MTFQSEKIPAECELYTFLGGHLDQTTTEAYGVLVFIAVMNIISFPITVVLNVLVIIAVKAKPRLKTMSNIALACLATTDAIMGVIGQPLFLAWITAILQKEATSDYCFVIRLTKEVTRVLATASLFHLTLVNVERYIAIHHSLKYMTMVTASRILHSSAFMWIGTLLLTVPFFVIDNNIYLTVSNATSSLSIAIIIFCQAVLYFETRRHEKEIASQQISVEARQKFLKDKKALKLTTTVLFFLILTYSPLLVLRILLVNSFIDSLNVAYIAFSTGSFAIILNSLINPIIYCVKIRQFRVAFIELLFKKSNAQAEIFEGRMFGTLNPTEPLEGREREENQNNEQENSNNIDINNNDPTIEPFS